MRQVYVWPTGERFLPDVLAFAVGLGAAWILHWKTTDLVWSLWLCSLVLGYLTILSTIFGWIHVGIKAVTHKSFPVEQRLPAVLVGSAIALFFLGFFSLHFCGFHAAHAGFLSLFFPLDGVPKNAFFEAFMNPFLLWKTVFRHLLTAYGVFLTPAIIAERKQVFASFAKAVSAIQEGMPNLDVTLFLQKGPERKKAFRDPFMRPYANVVRMHLLIFFFAACHLLKFGSFAVYAVVYFVYFFPLLSKTALIVRVELLIS